MNDEPNEVGPRQQLLDESDGAGEAQPFQRTVGDLGTEQPASNQEAHTYLVDLCPSIPCLEPSSKEIFRAGVEWVNPLARRNGEQNSCVLRAARDRGPSCIGNRVLSTDSVQQYAWSLGQTTMGHEKWNSVVPGKVGPK